MKFVDDFGADVFNDAVMQARLPRGVYKSLKKTILTGSNLDKNIADVVAAAMKDWAIEKGATHFAHWFQPMTGTTAAKHESFLEPEYDRRAIVEFSGKNLIKGEPDASSFPSGGLRDTFEARGYTSWDPTSPAFVRGTSLYIPSVFYSYTGNILDKKTPLLRSIERVSKEGLRILRLFGDQLTEHVNATLGVEQEYFLVSENSFKKRDDLIICGRTLIGAPSPKGQEFGDHYFGTITERVESYMEDVDRQLWRLGVPSKVKHSEVAPHQFELVPVFDTANVANDHNQLVMAVLRQTAAHHGLACLLHEKPFSGVNGSGKHVNWSLSTSAGVNLLDPGDTPEENARFLLLIVAMLNVVDSYPEILRLVAGSAGNDKRLGAGEAPPAILSIFLGEELMEILESIEQGGHYVSVDKGYMELGIRTLPKLPKDISDRNRTSPFAFTGNKFEFRMVGSSASVAGPSIALNTAFAQTLKTYADRLEKADDFWRELSILLAEEIAAHKRIVFNGNNYTDEWVEEAAKRGLPNIPTSVEGFKYYTMPKNIALFVENGIYTEKEVYSRQEIHYLEYAWTTQIEAATLLNMVRREIIPAVVEAENQVAEVLAKKLALKEHLALETTAEEALLSDLSTHLNALQKAADVLADNMAFAHDAPAGVEQAEAYEQKVVTQMQVVRKEADALENLTDARLWPYPTYADLLLEYA